MKKLMNNAYNAISQYSYINYVGFYPFDTDKIGNRFPAVLIEKGNESVLEPQTKGHVNKSIELNLYLYTFTSKELEHIDIQEKIEKDILKDSGLIKDGVHCIYFNSVTEGSIRDNFDYDNPNISGNYRLKQISFNVAYRGKIYD